MDKKTVNAISEIAGIDRRTVKKRLKIGGAVPVEVKGNMQFYDWEEVEGLVLGEKPQAARTTPEEDKGAGILPMIINGVASSTFSAFLDNCRDMVTPELLNTLVLAYSKAMEQRKYEELFGTHEELAKTLRIPPGEDYTKPLLLLPPWAVSQLTRKTKRKVKYISCEFDR
jgi:hypothetical protein